MACGAGTVKAEAVANRETKHAAWAMSLLAREQVLFAMPFPDGAAQKKKEKKENCSSRRESSIHRTDPHL